MSLLHLFCHANLSATPEPNHTTVDKNPKVTAGTAVPSNNDATGLKCCAGQSNWTELSFSPELGGSKSETETVGGIKMIQSTIIILSLIFTKTKYRYT